MAVVLGLLVALFYGAGDFLGGLASKRTPTSAVVAGSFAVSTVALGAIVAGWWVLAAAPGPAAGNVVLGFLAGLIAPMALGLLYRGLAVGRMSVVAPTTAVVAAIVPFGWGLLHDERPATVALVGAVVALVAVGFISGAPSHPEDVRSGAGTTGPSATVLILTALASGLGFGVIFVLFGSTDGAVLWPLLSARVVALAVTGTALAGWCRWRHLDLRPAVLAPIGAWGLIAATGILDVTANGLYLLATQRGLLSIVAVLSSLYPAATVVSARVFLGERLHVIQVAGLALAAGGVVAMAGA